MAKRRKGGWYGEPFRHALAARGISTVGPVVKRTPRGRTRELAEAVERTLAVGVPLQDIQRIVTRRNPWFSSEELKEIKNELRQARIRHKIKKEERKTEAERLASAKLKTKREIEEGKREARVTRAVTKEKVKGAKLKRKLTREEWKLIKELREEQKEHPLVEEVLVR